MYQFNSPSVSLVDEKLLNHDTNIVVAMSLLNAKVLLTTFEIFGSSACSCCAVFWINGSNNRYIMAQVILPCVSCCKNAFSIILLDKTYLECSQSSNLHSFNLKTEKHSRKRISFFQTQLRHYPAPYIVLNLTKSFFLTLTLNITWQSNLNSPNTKALTQR